jgi:hypothetical protein
MTVLCTFIIEDIILDHVLRSYVENTPFLKIKKIDIEELGTYKTLCMCDLIIIESDVIQSEYFESLKKIINSKPILFISDNKNLINIYGFENAVSISKSLNYSDFVTGISVLIDNQNTKSLSKYSS